MLFFIPLCCSPSLSPSIWNGQKASTWWQVSPQKKNAHLTSSSRKSGKISHICLCFLPLDFFSWLWLSPEHTALCFLEAKEARGGRRGKQRWVCNFPAIHCVFNTYIFNALHINIYQVKKSRPGLTRMQITCEIGNALVVMTIWQYVSTST